MQATSWLASPRRRTESRVRKGATLKDDEKSPLRTRASDQDLQLRSLERTLNNETGQAQLVNRQW